MQYITKSEWEFFREAISYLYRTIHIFTQEHPDFFDDMVISTINYIQVTYKKSSLADITACIANIPGDFFNNTSCYWSLIVWSGNLWMPRYEERSRDRKNEVLIQTLMTSFRALHSIDQNKIQQEQLFLEFIALYQLREEEITIYQSVDKVIENDLDPLLVENLIGNLEIFLKNINFYLSSLPREEIKNSVRQFQNLIYYYKYLNTINTYSQTGNKLRTKSYYTVIRMQAVIPLNNEEYVIRENEECKSERTIKRHINSFNKLQNEVAFWQQKYFLDKLTTEDWSEINQLASYLQRCFETFRGDEQKYFDAVLNDLRDKIDQRNDDIIKICNKLFKDRVNYWNQLHTYITKQSNNKQSQKTAADEIMTLLLHFANHDPDKTGNEARNRILELIAIYQLAIIWSELINSLKNNIKSSDSKEVSSVIQNYLLVLECYEHSLPTEIKESANQLRTVLLYFLLANAKRDLLFLQFEKPMSFLKSVIMLYNTSEELTISDTETRAATAIARVESEFTKLKIEINGVLLKEHKEEARLKELQECYPLVDEKHTDAAAKVLGLKNSPRKGVLARSTYSFGSADDLAALTKINEKKPSQSNLVIVLRDEDLQKGNQTETPIKQKEQISVTQPETRGRRKSFIEGALPNFLKRKQKPFLEKCVEESGSESENEEATVPRHK